MARFLLRHNGTFAETATTDVSCSTVNIIEHLESTMAGFLTGPHYPFDSVNGMGEKSSPRGDEPISGALSECKVPSHRKIDEPLPRIAKYSSLASFGDRYANDSGSHARSVLIHSCSVCGQEFHSFALLSAHISTHVAAANSTATRARATIDVVDCADSPPVKTPTPSMRCSFCGYATPNAVDFFEHTAAHVDDTDGASTNLFMSAQQLRSQSLFPVETSPQSLADAVRREAAKYSVQIGVVVDKSPAKTLNMPSTSVAYGNHQALKAHVCLTSSSAGTMVEPPSSPFSPLTPSSASPTSSRVATMVTATTESNAMVPSFVYSPESPSETTTTTTRTTTESEYVDNKAANTGVNTLVAARRNSAASATAASAPAGHVCTTCGKSFRLRSYLRIHQRLHTGDLPYSCPVCGKRFNQSWNRNVHMRIHSGIQPYRCKLCSKNFRSAVRLREHLSVVHGTQQNESLDHMQRTSLLRQAAEIGAAKNGYVY